MVAVPTTLVRAAVPSMEKPHDYSNVDDFDELWETLDRRYAFFWDKQTDWQKVRSKYRPMAIAAQNDGDMIEIVRRVLSELYDEHTHVHNLPKGTLRSPPVDMLVERDTAALRITAIEKDGPAEKAGLVIGDRIVEVGGRPVSQLVLERMPTCLRRPDPAADRYAINAAVAGSFGEPRRYLVASRGQAAREVVVPLMGADSRPNIEWRMLDGDIGYVVIRSFADAAVVDSFNKALVELRGSRGLIIDVTDNGGGDTAVARPIMGRFITEPKAYAIMRRRDGDGLGAPWTEYVDPRGPFTYSNPVVVLISHWSGSMAEGFPMGMRDIGRATIVGTPMMRVGAAVYDIRLDRSGIEAQYSGEPVYDTRGRPRWLLEPDVDVPDGYDILKAAITVLEKQI